MDAKTWTPMNIYGDRERASGFLRDSAKKFPQFEYRIREETHYVVEIRDNREEKEQDAST